LLAYVVESRRPRIGNRFNRLALRDARHVMFDDDTRFVFASPFDGSWDDCPEDVRYRRPNAALE